MLTRIVLERNIVKAVYLLLPRLRKWPDPFSIAAVGQLGQAIKKYNPRNEMITFKKCYKSCKFGFKF